MEIKVLAVALVEKDGRVLMRKKPAGSPPYKETWYIFGATITPEVSIDEAVKHEVKSKSGVDVTLGRRISWDTEIKKDLDGVEKFFVYLDVICNYVDGEFKVGEGVEKLEWVEKNDLGKYDIVPPSRVLFEKLGYI